jgi:hypothetical protein
MSINKKLRPYIVTIAISTTLIAINILLFLFYWMNNGLNPSNDIIEKYAIRNNDPSVCYLAYSPLNCLNNLANAEFRTWSYNLGHPDLSILKGILSECSEINNTDLELLCELNKKQNFPVNECMKIKNKNAFNDCIREGAALTKNADTCENVVATLQPNNFTKADRVESRQAILQGCLERVGRIIQDKSVCYRLQSHRRESCIIDIELSIKSQQANP